MPEEVSVRALRDVRGAWRRSLLVRPNGDRDFASFVVWMQGARHFVDLRQPPGRPCFAEVAAACDLTWTHLAWMTRQEGFAGELVLDGEFVEWRRSLDLQPPTGDADSARLWFEGATLVEQGRHAPYLERWEPLLAAPPVRAASARLRRDGREGVVVRCDGWFMLMLGRHLPLPPGPPLAARLAAGPTLAEAQGLFACEVALGRAAPGAWRVERSTLPWHEGRAMSPRLTGGAGWMHALAGAADEPAWRITEADGDPAALAA